MLRVAGFLLLLFGCGLCVVPSPSCPPGVKNCVPPSPASATVVGEYPIEVTSSLPNDGWKKNPFGAATVYEVKLAADSPASGTCSSPSSITVDQHGLVTSCTSTPPSPAAGFYSFPSNLLVSSEGLVESVDNNTSPTFENITAEVINSTSVLTPNDVLYYGAKCDGVTDDTSAINRAVNSGKGLLKFPAGRCVIRPPAGVGGNAVVLPSNVTLLGQRMGITVISCVPFNTSSYGSCLSVASGAQNVTIAKLTVKYAGDPGSFGYLFVLRSSNRIVLDGVELDGSVVVTATNSTSHWVTAINFPDTGALSNLIFRNIEVHNVTWGLLQTNAATVSLSDIRVTDSWFHDNIADDISMNAPKSASSANIIISRNIVENNQGYRTGRSSIAIGYAGGGVGVVIDANEVSGVYAFNAIHIEEGPYEFVISNNVLNIQGAGITLQWNNVSSTGGSRPTHGVVSGNVVHLASRSSFYSSGVSDGINVVYDAAYDRGVLNAVEITIVNNVVSGQFARGITVATNSWHVVSLESNKVDGADVCYSTVGGSYLFTDNIASNCSVGVSANRATMRNQAFYNVVTPTYVTKMLSLQNVIFELPRGSCASMDYYNYNLLPLNASTYMSFSAQLASGILGGGSTDVTSRVYTQLLYDGTTFFPGPTTFVGLGAQAPSLDLSGGSLRARLFCGAAANNISMEVTLTGYYGYGPGGSVAAFTGVFTTPNLNVRGYGYVGTSVPGSTAIGDWTAVRLFQAGVQVIDTLTAGTDISISGSGNSRTVSMFGASGTPTFASFGTGACTGGGTAPTLTIAAGGNTRTFYVTLVTGTGSCGTGEVFTINLGTTFPTKAICQLTDGLQNQGVSGFGVNRYIQTTTNQLIVNTFTTVSPANNNIFSPLFQYEWQVTCGGY